MKRRNLVVGAGVGSALTLLPAWSAAVGRGETVVRGAALGFGTTLAISARSRDPGAARAAIGQALAEVQLIDRLMSLHRDDSQLAQLNRQGWLADPHPHLARNLAMAMELAQSTRGAFDPSVQPLWDAYAEARPQGRLPTEPAIESARRRTGWQGIERARGGIRLRPGMGLTLNAVAQGYAADVAAAILRRAGVRDALIDTGEFGALGQAAPDRPWTLGLQDPRAPGHMIAALRMDGRFLVTSGDYATTFSADFANHHIIDPARGRSPLGFSCVAVAAPTGLLADGLATSLMLLDRERGRALLAGHTGCDAVWIDKHDHLQATAGMPLVRSSPLPTATA